MACLVTLEGPDADRMIPLGQGVIVLGRDESLKAQLADPRCSRRHFRVSYSQDDGRHVLEDMGSKNGTRLNGRHVVNTTPLQADVAATGDRIGAGESILAYLVEDHPTAESALEAAKKLGERDIRTISDIDS